MAEGNLKDIVYGAIEGGTPPEVVARCATNAGAEPKDIAQYISSAGSPGLCYVQPEKLETMEIWLPGENPDRGYLSSQFITVSENIYLPLFRNYIVKISMVIVCNLMFYLTLWQSFIILLLNIMDTFIIINKYYIIKRL